MRSIVSLLCVFIVFQIGFSQNKSKIDSINRIVVHEIKIPLEKLVQLFQQNITDADQLNYLEGKAAAYYNLSLAYSYQGNNQDKAAETLLSSIRMYESLDNKEKMAQLYGQLGYGMKRRDLNKAMYYMQQGIKIAKDNNFNNELKDLYNNYGVLKQWNEEVDSAAYFFEEGLQIKRELKDDFGIPYSLSNLAGAYLVKKNHAKAIALLEESIDLRKKLGDSTGLGENFTQLAEVYYDNGEANKALELFKKSIKIASEKKYIQLEQFNYEYISKIFQEANQADSALYYFKKYIAIKDTMFTEKQEAKIAELTIAYETEKKELALAESTLKIKQKNTLLASAVGGILLLSLVGFLIYKQERIKNNQLKKEAELKTALASIELKNKLEEQRLQISRDLHDNIGSQLTFVISGLQYLQYQQRINIEEVKSKLAQLGQFTQQTIHELRDTIWAMNKDAIELPDLIHRLNNFITQLEIREDIYITKANQLSAKLASIEFSAFAGIQVYRIIQEAINNAIKHAASSTITVNFSVEEEHLQVEIIDDGKGFEVDHQSQGNGLQNMRKRGEKLSAKMHINSSLNKGTNIHVTIPLTSKNLHYE